MGPNLEDKRIEWEDQAALQNGGNSLCARVDVPAQGGLGSEVRQELGERPVTITGVLLGSLCCSVA